MFDIGWTELLLIGIVALIVIGPRDLPGMFHTLGRFVARAKAMAREFQTAMNEAAKETGVDEVAADLKKATSARAMGLDKLKDAATRFEEWDPAASVSGKKAPKAEELTPERAEVAEKIRSATAKSAAARKAGEAAGPDKAGGAAGKKAAGKAGSGRKAAAATGAEAAGKPIAKKAAAKKAAGKKAAAKKPAAGKTGA